jgi:protein arginine kinase activator
MCERPLECNQCKKEIKIEFKEIKGRHINHLHACSDCPILAARLHLNKESKAETICPICKTSEEAIKTGGLLGCEQCYSFFSGLIIDQLGKLNKVMSTPELFSLPSSDRLKELSIALDSAVENENYEQAAWLRDRMKSVMEGKSD